LRFLSFATVSRCRVLRHSCLVRLVRSALGVRRVTSIATASNCATAPDACRPALGMR
jgi:hypothetical protein